MIIYIVKLSDNVEKGKNNSHAKPQRAQRKEKGMRHEFHGLILKKTVQAVQEARCGI
jgi:hypothetical protein